MSNLTLREFKSSPNFRFCEGTWFIEYNDQTHLKDAYIRLGRCEIERSTQDHLCLFRFYPQSRVQLKRCIDEAWQRINVNGNRDSNKAAKTIFDQIGESMVRLGLLKPRFEIENRSSFIDRGYATLVLDTNALRSSAVRHLQEQFPRIRLWVIIPTVVLMEIGEKIANITAKEKAGCKASNSGIIRSRPQVTVAPQTVSWIREHFPSETLELAPELFRAFRGYETKSDPNKEPDRISINDRLILEGIKDLRRKRDISENVYLMSGDKDMSRLARLEGIQTIFPDNPDIQEVDDGVYSMRYSIESRAHMVSSLHRFLWDLAHVFSTIRIRKSTQIVPDTEQLELSYYYRTKLVNDWVEDRLEVRGFGPGIATDSV